MNEVVEQQQPMQVMSVVAITERINAIQQVTRSKMIGDVHYGVIPGTKKPTLYKAGSEMLLTMFQVGVTVDVIDLSTADRIKYRVTVTGIHTPTGRAIGQGVGECSSAEEKYQWRNAVCEEEFDATPESRRRFKWTKGWDRGQSTIFQSKQVRTSPDDLSNTVLKMAKKRAQIDMTLTALGVSDLFNQDIEDLPPELRQGAADERGDGAGAAVMGAAPIEHAGMKAASSTQELAKIMSSMKQDEKKKYVAYFNVRMTELKESAQ